MNDLDSVTEELVVLLPTLRPLCDALQCHVCYNHFAGPVLLPCGHSFCSQCIRKDLAYKQQVGHALACPICRHHVTAEALIPNIVLREAIGAFKALLPSVKQLVDGFKAQVHAAHAAAHAQAHAAHGSPSAPGRKRGKAASQQLQQPMLPLQPHHTHQQQQQHPHQQHQQQQQNPQVKQEIVLLDQSDSDSPPRKLLRQAGSPSPPPRHVTSSSATPDSQDRDPDYRPGSASRQGARRGRVTAPGRPAGGAGRQGVGSLLLQAAAASPVQSHRYNPGVSAPTQHQAAAALAAPLHGYNAEAQSAGIAGQSRTQGAALSGPALHDQHPPAYHFGSNGAHSHGATTPHNPGTSSAPPLQPAQHHAPPHSLAPEGPYVSCPACNMSVKQDLINIHLDNCVALARGSALPPRRTSSGSGGAGPSHRRPTNHNRQQDPTNHHQTAGNNTGAGSGRAATTTNAAGGAAGAVKRSHPMPPAPAGASNRRNGGGGRGATAADIPGKLVFSMLKDKDIKARLKSLGLPAEGTRDEMIERYGAYRVYIQSKIDAGSTMPLPQLRDSFLAQQRQQQAARRASPALAVGQLGGLAVGQLGSRGGPGGRLQAGQGSNRSSPEVFEMEGDQMVARPASREGGGAGGGRDGQVAGEGFTFSGLIAQVAKRKRTGTSPGATAAAGGSSEAAAQLVVADAASAAPAQPVATAGEPAAAFLGGAAKSSAAPAQSVAAAVANHAATWPAPPSAPTLSYPNPGASAASVGPVQGPAVVGSDVGQSGTGGSGGGWVGGWAGQAPGKVGLAAMSGAGNVLHSSGHTAGSSGVHALGHASHTMLSPAQGVHMQGPAQVHTQDGHEAPSMLPHPAGLPGDHTWAPGAAMPEPPSSGQPGLPMPHPAGPAGSHPWPSGDIHQPLQSGQAGSGVPHSAPQPGLQLWPAGDEREGQQHATSARDEREGQQHATGAGDEGEAERMQGAAATGTSEDFDGSGEEEGGGPGQPAWQWDAEHDIDM